jgi:hypothetical protein
MVFQYKSFIFKLLIEFALYWSVQNVHAPFFVHVALIFLKSHLIDKIAQARDINFKLPEKEKKYKWKYVSRKS